MEVNKYFPGSLTSPEQKCSGTFDMPDSTADMLNKVRGPGCLECGQGPAWEACMAIRRGGRQLVLAEWSGRQFSALLRLHDLARVRCFGSMLCHSSTSLCLYSPASQGYTDSGSTRTFVLTSQMMGGSCSLAPGKFRVTTFKAVSRFNDESNNYDKPSTTLDTSSVASYFYIGELYRQCTGSRARLGTTSLGNGRLYAENLRQSFRRRSCEPQDTGCLPQPLSPIDSHPEPL